MILERLQELHNTGRVREKGSLNRLYKKYVHPLDWIRQDQNCVKRRCRELLP